MTRDRRRRHRHRTGPAASLRRGHEPAAKLVDRLFPDFRILLAGSLQIQGATRHRRYHGWSAQTDQQALAFIEEMSSVVLFPRGTWVQLAVADRATDGLIGDIGVCVATNGMSAELGFTVSPAFHGQGLGTETAREAMSLLFDHSSVIQVVCITDARNSPAVRLLERIGMRRVATADTVFRGEPCVEHTYAAYKGDGG
jgi:RimJ/RimL family protein N-acetyltransferase